MAINTSGESDGDYHTHEEGDEEVQDDGKPTGTNKEATSGTSREKCTKASDPAAKTGYIHVRARRGQATDSHSLAERARREKISKRMKLLQDLVPGCSRITGKAGVLDEIINYVQSLQRQVEFLSMKLASVNPILDSNIDAFLSKEVMQMIPHHGGVLPSSAGTLPLAPLDGSFLNHVNTTQTQQAVAAPTAVHCSSSLNNKVAVSSSCPGEQTLLLHPTPRAPVAVSEGCLVMDPYKDVHVLAATSLWEADLHAHYSVYE
ncbi:hypothetical protein Taro_031264 [Colocasia esculenta]|uniref:BHLH domain-containing protein n=1 Tax=Colocasia esculenta TaxID=4460 RepID=A0A843VIG1_COLES|nr:hypothetical protein [Colocasia esculenta]